MATTLTNTIKTLVPAEVRAALAANPDLGAGNFFWHALQINPEPEADLLWLERPYISLRGSAYSRLSLATMAVVVRQLAAWYHGAGVQAKEVVAVYLDDCVDYFIHYVALTSLGAIPALINGVMPADQVAEHLRRIGAVGLFTDSSHFAQVETLARPNWRFLVTAEQLRRDGAAASLPPLPQRYPFVHDAEDPVMIAHSSGTTGQPKPVLLQHAAFFYGIRYRLAQPPAPGEGGLLSLLPHSHNCAVAYIVLALVCGHPVFILSDHSGRNLLEQTQAWRPSVVVAFPETFVEAVDAEPADFDLASVKLWMNGGDAAHEVHIRQLLAVTPGARFIDGMGSSEMGFSLFKHVHTAASDHYDRCVGKPHPWVEAVVLDENGVERPHGQVGRLAVRAPSVTSGYWNDSLLTHQTRIGGFWLTGDLAYRDDSGWFYHVDRSPDVVRTEHGPLYSLAAEELLLKHCPELSDCTVFAKRGVQEPDAAFAVVRLRGKAARGRRPVDAARLRDRFNEVLSNAGWPRLAGVQIVQTGAIPLGATGKVLKSRLRDQYTEASHV